MIINEDLEVNGQIRQKKTGNTDSPGHCPGQFNQCWNDGKGQSTVNNGGYCFRYESIDENQPFDTGYVFSSNYHPPTASGHYTSEWHVSCSPPVGQGQWTISLSEWNIGNRGADMGYRDNIAGERTSMGILMVATVPNAYKINGHLGYNVDVAFVTARGDPSYNGPQFYNGFMTAPDSIAPGGRGLQVAGSFYTTSYPFSPMEVTQSWQSGIRLEKAQIADGKAIVVSPNQKVVRTDGTEAVFLTPEQIVQLKRLLR